MRLESNQRFLKVYDLRILYSFLLSFYSECKKEKIKKILKFTERKTKMRNFIAFTYEHEYWYERRNSSIESVSICRAQKGDIDH
jgi:hypothetical protein